MCVRCCLCCPRWRRRRRRQHQQPSRAADRAQDRVKQVAWFLCVCFQFHLRRRRGRKCWTELKLQQKNKQQQQTGNVCADKINKTTKKQKKHLNGLINTQQQQRVEHFLCVVFGFASASSSSAPCLLLLAAHKVQVIKFCCYCYYLCLVCLSWSGSRRFA